MVIRWPRLTRGRHRPTKTAGRLDDAAGSITAMRQADPDSESDGSPKGPGFRQPWRAAHKQAKGAMSGYVGEAALQAYPLVETWETARKWPNAERITRDLRP